MDSKFLAHIESLRPKLEKLLAMSPVKPTRLPAEMPQAGVYLLSDELPSMTSLFGLRRNRAVDTVKLKEDALAAVTFSADDEVRLIVTDLLWLDDTSLLDIPLLERRRLLEGVLEESDAVRIGAYVRPPIHTWVGSWRSQGFEGITFKAANSRYLPGASNPDWVVSGMPRR